MCSENSECKSGFCSYTDHEIIAKQPIELHCMQKNSKRSGVGCWWNEECQSGQCLNIYGSAYKKCSKPSENLDD